MVREPIGLRRNWYVYCRDTSRIHRMPGPCQLERTCPSTESAIAEGREGSRVELGVFALVASDRHSKSGTCFYGFPELLD